jgi:hypothetical protein
MWLRLQLDTLLGNWLMLKAWSVDPRSLAARLHPVHPRR